MVGDRINIPNVLRKLINMLIKLINPVIISTTCNILVVDPHQDRFKIIRSSSKKLRDRDDTAIKGVD